MLTTSQRLVGLFILYKTYLHANVKTTPFYQMMLDLFAKKNPISISEKELLLNLIQSVPKVSKMTPKQYIEMSTRDKEKYGEVDLEPYRKAHVENMPCISLLHSASIMSSIDDFENQRLNFENFSLDDEEVLPQEFLPNIHRPIPSSDESYLFQSVPYMLLIN